MELELTDQDLRNIEAGLVRQHNSILSKKRKLRPSERVAWVVDVKGTLDKIKAERARRNGG